MIDYSKTLLAYKERVQKIALFKVFYDVDRKRKTDHSGKGIRYMDLLLISLLFFFENMLSRHHQTTKADLARYLFEVCHRSYDLREKDYLDIATELIEVLRPTDGSKPHMDFMNFETEQEDRVDFRLLKVSGWDKEENKQFYSLDEDGLELIFATKEFYSEFSLSISQLILRKQLDKGEFNLALRQIDEMRISVNSIKQNMQRLKIEIISNIISDEVYERYKKLIEDIHLQLQREHKEFLELLDFVKETRQRFEALLNQTEKEQKSYQAISRVSNELTEVHNMHTSLLQESIEFKNRVMEAAQESLSHLGLDKFNFDQDILRKLMARPVALENLYYFAKPFLGVSQPKYWSPIRIFAEQRLERRDGEKTVEYYDQLLEQEENDDIGKMQDIYETAFGYILAHMEKQRISSGEMAKILEKMEMSTSLKRSIMQCFILMHYYQVLDVAEVKASSVHIFNKAFMALADGQSLIASAKQQLVEDQFMIMTDIELRLEERKG